MYPESDLLPLSALQHLAYCPRQCALIHLERVWEENLCTAEGRVQHEHVHDAGAASRRGVRFVCGLALRSFRLGLFGQADVVEFHGKGRALRPFPVEHKRGRSKSHDADRIQLCAQAMCLEEMLGVEVPVGALFYATPRRREEVELTEALRAATTETAARLHELMAAGETPPARYDRKKCGLCSLKGRCLPEADGREDRVARYLKRMLAEGEGE